MISRIKILPFAMLALLLCAARCKKPGPDEPNPQEFDRSALLTNLADNYIVPAYQDFELKVLKLDTAVSNFNSIPDLSNLNALRSSWNEALLSWQGVAFIKVGYGNTIEQRTQFNIFPIDTAQIEANISFGSYDLGIPANLAAKGFQAFDYLLYGIGSNDSEIIGKYTIDTEALQRLLYLSDLSTDMKTYAQAILVDWTNSYRDTFVANSINNSAGSSMSLFVNAYIEHFEAYVRKGKLGLPAGVFNIISGTPMPDHVECYYSGQSLPYLEESLEKHRTYFNGESFDGISNGTGLDDYLVFLNSQLEGQSMQLTINEQFATAISAVQGLSDPLSDEVVVNQSNCTSAYTELQKIVAYLKTDMVSELGIQITYADNDGD